MSDSNKLPKKVRKYYARLIRRKLDEMGIKNQINMTPTGKKRTMWVADKDGRIKMKDGKPEQRILDVLMARNVYKNTLKTLLRSGTDAINAFLSVPSSPKG